MTISSRGAQPAAIQMNGAADNSTNSNRVIILHVAPRIIFHPAPNHAHSQFPAVALRSHQPFRSLVGNSWCHPSDGRCVCWRHFRGPLVILGPGSPRRHRLCSGGNDAYSSSAASYNVCKPPFNQRSDNTNCSLLALILSTYLLFVFILNGLSNFSDGSFLAESSASDIIAASGLCGGIYLASAVAAGRLTLITKSPQRTST